MPTTGRRLPDRPPMIGAILLAAGHSRRFGADKRITPLTSGDTLLETSIGQASTSFDDVLVVLRSGETDFKLSLESQFSDGVSFFCAPDSTLGMAHSLANAIAYVAAHPGYQDWTAVAILLADMPYVSTSTTDFLKKTFADNLSLQPIVVPTFDGTPGHPVIFHRRFFKAMQNLEGDQGARTVIEANPDHLIRAPVEDNGVLKDIDTIQDLAPD